MTNPLFIGDVVPQRRSFFHAVLWLESDQDLDSLSERIAGEACFEPEKPAVVHGGRCVAFWTDLAHVVSTLDSKNDEVVQALDRYGAVDAKFQDAAVLALRIARLVEAIAAERGVVAVVRRRVSVTKVGSALHRQSLLAVESLIPALSDLLRATPAPLGRDLPFHLLESALEWMLDADFRKNGAKATKRLLDGMLEDAYRRSVHEGHLRDVFRLRQLVRSESDVRMVEAAPRALQQSLLKELRENERSSRGEAAILPSDTIRLSADAQAWLRASTSLA